MIAQPDNQELLPWLLLVRHSFSLSKVCSWLLSKFESDTTIDKNYSVIVCCLNDFVSLSDVNRHRKWDGRESELRENLQEGKRVCLVTFSCYDEYEHNPLTFTWKCCCLESAFASEPLESLNCPSAAHYVVTLPRPAASNQSSAGYICFLSCTVDVTPYGNISLSLFFLRFKHNAFLYTSYLCSGLGKYVFLEVSRNKNTNWICVQVCKYSWMCLCGNSHISNQIKG